MFNGRTNFIEAKMNTIVPSDILSGGYAVWFVHLSVLIDVVVNDLESLRGRGVRRYAVQREFIGGAAENSHRACIRIGVKSHRSMLTIIIYQAI